MRQWLRKWWDGYKFRFVPWIALNVKHTRPAVGGSKKDDLQRNISEKSNMLPHPSKVPPEEVITVSGHVPVEHVSKTDDRRISNSEFIMRLTNFLKLCKHPLGPLNAKSTEVEAEASSANRNIMRDHFGFTIERCKSLVSPDAGTGVFVTSGIARAGSTVALYPGTIYMPFEPLFFPSLGNPFIFRCSDGIHIDGNDKWISKSIYKSCAARDRFDFTTPCCDTSWLNRHNLINPLSIGQYVNNRSKSQRNNVVYQEHFLPLPSNSRKEHEYFPVELFKFLPNVWSDPHNNRFGLKLISLIAVEDIFEGEEILSSYFTVVHPEKESTSVGI